MSALKTSSEPRERFYARLVTCREIVRQRRIKFPFQKHTGARTAVM